MRPDLHREYKNPKTGLAASVTEIAKDFNLGYSTALYRLNNRLPLVKKENKQKQDKKTKVSGREILTKMIGSKKVRAINPLTGEMQNKTELSKSLGISVVAAKIRIRKGTVRCWNPEKRVDSQNKKRAAREEMRKLIAEMDARKINNGHT